MYQGYTYIKCSSVKKVHKPSDNDCSIKGNRKKVYKRSDNGCLIKGNRKRTCNFFN